GHAVGRELVVLLLADGLRLDGVDVPEVRDEHLLGQRERAVEELAPLRVALREAGVELAGEGGGGGLGGHRGNLSLFGGRKPGMLASRPIAATNATGAGRERNHFQGDFSADGFGGRGTRAGLGSFGGASAASSFASSSAAYAREPSSA